jgi:hypothetical protein
MSQLTMNYLARPKNQMAHLLYEMLNGRMIAEQDFSYNRFRGSISDMITKHNVPIRHKDVPFVNSFGRSSTYRKHYVLEIDHEECTKIYNRINNGF